jgi:hydroxyacylglutathione hydrolase
MGAAGRPSSRVARRGQEVVFVGCDDEEAARGARFGAAVGITNVAGYLAGGMNELAEGEALDRRDRAHRPPRPPRADREVQILDVREHAEWDAGHIPGSIHTPYHYLGDRSSTSSPSGITTLPLYT